MGDIATLRSPDRALSDEVARVIRSSSGEWTPGSNDGEAVPASIALPVLFRIAGGTTLPADAAPMSPAGGDVDEIVVTTFAD